MAASRTIVIDGVERRISDVRRESGVSRQLYAVRIDRGWDVAKAASTPPRQRDDIDEDGQRISDLRRGSGVSPETYAYRVSRGWSKRDAAAIIPGETERSHRGPRERLRDVTDGRDVGLSVAARENGISGTALEFRLRKGWPASIAAIMPPGEIGVWRDGERSAGGRRR